MTAEQMADLAASGRYWWMRADGTFYAYEGHRSWNSLIPSVELAGFDHLVLKDLSEISREIGPLYQEEPIVHVVFDKKYIQEIHALETAIHRRIPSEE